MKNKTNYLKKVNPIQGREQRKALKQDGKKLITEHGTYLLEDNNPIYYGELNVDTAQLLKACKQLKFGNTPRTGGLKTNAAPFGSKPANPRKDNFCSQAAMEAKFPESNTVFREFSKAMAQIYEEQFPKIFSKNKEILKHRDRSVIDEYIIGNTPYTSGIVNHNNALKYHHDWGNYPGMMSAMIVLKKNVVGGDLVLPEYDVTFKIKNNTIILFDGQKILHGVSHIYNPSKKGYRYSIVYYSMKDLWKCLPYEEELLTLDKKLK